MSTPLIDSRFDLLSFALIITYTYTKERVVCQYDLRRRAKIIVLVPPTPCTAASHQHPGLRTEAPIQITGIYHSNSRQSTNNSPQVRLFSSL